ncbi:MAG: tetraacyldisaccharide 4'-kinase [Saprospiraceae bacterium]
MILQKLIAILLSPFSFLYGIGVSLYQALFFSGLIKPVRFSFPVISVGNLTIGGTGKSPHIEYLIRLLQDYIELAVLSRGYKRKTAGFLLLTPDTGVSECGDEPKQIKLNFPEIPVAVSESRAIGIPRLLRNLPDLKLILLDDAFQHLAVKPGLSILLTEYNKPFSEDYLLPSGRLREWRFGAARADCIIVSKCPDEMPDETVWREKLQLKPHQKLFFSKIQYGVPYNILKPEQKFVLNPGLHITLISAIAQSFYLLNYLSKEVASVTDFNFEDHHYFTQTELSGILLKHQQISHPNKMLLTTQKDATRLTGFKDYFETSHIEVYAIPIEVDFFNKFEFDQYIKNYLLEYKV